MVMILSEPIAWSPAVRTVFGYAARIQIVEEIGIRFIWNYGIGDRKICLLYTSRCV